MALCGALPEEKERPQPFELDIEVELDLSRPGRTDALEDTVDYGELVSQIEAVTASESFTLMEALAQRVADVALADERVDEVVVEIRKLRPPVAHHLDTSGVRIMRRRV